MSPRFRVDDRLAANCQTADVSDRFWPLADGDTDKRRFRALS